MANQEHLDILKQGGEVWNQWRKEHPGTMPDLSDAYLNNSDLSFAHLSDANLKNANLSHTTLKSADLNNSDLSGADLEGADLSYAFLRDANIYNTQLDGANLWRSRLRNANLRSANLRRAVFTTAGLERTNFSEARISYTSFNDCDFSHARGLESVIHQGPSTIGINTIYKSGGDIPEAFLRGCGVPDTFITFAKSLVGKAIDYYSAFISYSSKNQDIAERLYADLQSKGVRCWFAPEDLKIGDPFRQRIDEAIRLHDKLLLILSAESVASNWVASEVEAALEREDREKRLVLFPVRIDDAVEQSDTAWAALLRRMRHIGDFSMWKDHDSYSKAFERLLRDLKAVDKA